MAKIGDAPCMGCEDRHFACHGQCSKYQEFREERDKQNKEKLKMSEISGYYKVVCQKKTRLNSKRRKP